VPEAVERPSASRHAACGIAALYQRVHCPDLSPATSSTTGRRGSRRAGGAGIPAAAAATGKSGWGWLELADVAARLDGQIPLTRNEISHLLTTLIIWPVRDAWHRLHWSIWRRRHQYRSRQCRYPAAGPAAMKITNSGPEY